MVSKIPMRTLKRIMKEKLPETRIRNEAVYRMVTEVDRFISEVCLKAQSYLKNSKRKSVLEKDIVSATTGR